jgi:very-long-chain (3R)-3-hydroxyacyl-CoA dehydratase
VITVLLYPPIAKIIAMEDPAYPNARRPKSLLSRKSYFLAYNGICLILWTTVTLRAIFLIPILLSHDHLYGLHDALHPLLTFTQSIAILEVLHSLVGIVRASPFTTAMQVASRFLLVWGVVGLFPEIVVKSRVFGVRTENYAGTKGGPYAYAGMILAWGITECIRYGFFVWKEGLGNGRVPKWLTWLRYVPLKLYAHIFDRVLSDGGSDTTPSSFCIHWASRASAGWYTVL